MFSQNRLQSVGLNRKFSHDMARNHFSDNEASNTESHAENLRNLNENVIVVVCEIEVQMDFS